MRRSTTSGVSSRPLVMMFITMLDAARLASLRQPLGEVVDDRQVQQRLAAEERQREALRPRSRPSVPRSTPRPAPRSPSTSSRRSCCTRRDRPGCSSRRRSCTAASSAPSRAAGPGRSRNSLKKSSMFRRSVSRLSTMNPFSASVANASRSHCSTPAERGWEPRSRRDPAGRAGPTTSRETISWASVKVFIRNTSSRSARGTRTLKIEGCMSCRKLSVGNRRLKRRWPALLARFGGEGCNRYSGGAQKVSKESYRGIQSAREPRKYCVRDRTLFHQHEP